MIDSAQQIEVLRGFAGHYTGTGENHESESFTGTLTLAATAAGAGLVLAFEAKGDGVVFHTESSLIGADPAGVLTLWNLGSNLGHVAPHPLVSWDQYGETAVAVFRHGITDAEGFVEEITFDCSPGSVRYAFAWGYPGDPLQPRSSVTMTPFDPSAANVLGHLGKPVVI